MEAKKRLPKELEGKGMFSAMTVWHYQSENDKGNICPFCDAFNGKDFLGSAIRTAFPDLMVIDAYQIYVNYHMTLWGKSTCYCYLWREEEPSAQTDLYNASTIYGEYE
jgi:hypothetical protein